MCKCVVFKLRNFIKYEDYYLKLQNNSDLTFISFSLSAFVVISDYTLRAQIRISKEVFSKGQKKLYGKPSSNYYS